MTGMNYQVSSLTPFDMSSGDKNGYLGDVMHRKRLSPFE